MKKIFSLILLSSCLGAPLSHAMDDDHFSHFTKTAPMGINASIYESYKDTLLRDFESIDYSTVALYCQKFAAVEKEAMDFLDASMVEPMDFLIPLAQQTLDYVDSLIEDYPHLKGLRNEINLRIESAEITPLWYHLIGLRIQAAISNVNDDELDLFKHTIDPGLAVLKGLTTKDAWKSYEKSALLIKNFRTKNHPLYTITYPVELSFEICDKILETLDKLLPPSVYYPLYNKTILGIPFLVHSFIHNIYPLAFSKVPGHGHGLDLSQLAFSAHDFLHAELDNYRKKILEQFVLDEVAAQLKTGDKELKSIPLILEYAVKRFNLLNEGLNNLFNAHLTQLNLTKDEAAFQRSMGGYFWTMHEKVTFNPDIYRVNNFNDVLNLMCDNPQKTTSVPSQESISLPSDHKEPDYGSWESPHELIITSPLTGETAETDEEIALKAMVYLKSGKSSTYAYINNENFSSYIDEKAPYTVETSPRFIDVTIIGKDAHKYCLSFPTLFHKWTNMDDNIGILNYAGLHLKKPHLGDTNNRNARGVAIKTLEIIKEELDKMVKNFLDVSVKLTTLERVYEGNDSIVREYQTQAEKLENEYRGKVKDLLHKSIT